MPEHERAFDYEPVTRGGGARRGRDGGDDAPAFAARRGAADAGVAPARARADRAGFSSPAESVGAEPPHAEPPHAVKGGAAQPSPHALKRGHVLSYACLFLFTTVLYFRPYELIPALAGLSQIAFYVGLVTLAVYLPTQLVLEGNLTARPREVNLVLLLALTALLSIPLAIRPSEGWATFNDVFVKAVLIFIVMINAVRTERRLRRLIFLSAAVSCFLSVAALRNYASGTGLVEGYRGRGSLGGIFDNPNDMAIHLVTVLPIMVALLFGARNLFKKLLYGAAAALTTAGVVVTFSRGAFLGLLASGVVLSLKLGRRNRFAVAALLVVVLAGFVALAPGEFAQRMMSIFGSGLDASGSQRQAILFRSLNTALHNPVFGIGMGNFHIVSIRELVSHNAYTQVAAEMGLAALVFYFLFMWTPLRRLRLIERETFDGRRTSHFYYLAVGLQGALVAYMVSSFFGSVAYQWYVYYLVGYAVSLRRIYEAEVGREVGVAPATEAATGAAAEVEQGAGAPFAPGAPARGLAAAGGGSRSVTP
ncbi:MAG: O-antigen ligase family protein [Acidobacteria bacterium]|nr:O-antigen ligase family protein [Acidobacteriota bacterium]